MKILAFTNEKGGVGKSTSAVNIAYLLQEKGYKVLLCDMDAQSNSSDTMRAQIDGALTMYEVLTDPNIKTSRAIQRTEFIDIIPACHALRDLESQARSNDISIHILKEKLSSLESYYDYIVIDSPPNLGFALYVTLIAADDIIIPMIADRYSIQGLLELYEAIEFIRENYNPDLNIAGILLTRHSDRMVFARKIRAYLEEFASDIGTKVFARAIRETIRVRESQTYKVPLIQSDPYGTATFDYRAVLEKYLGE